MGDLPRHVLGVNSLYLPARYGDCLAGTRAGRLEMIRLNRQAARHGYAMNDDLEPPRDPRSMDDLARRAKKWAWYVRGHFCLNVFWALAMLGLFQGIPRRMERLLDGVLECSAIAIPLGPILSAVLITRARRYGGDFVKLAVADAFLSATAFWIILPAVQ